MAELDFIDVSGVGNTGKSAVVDLLREFPHLWVPEYWFEFDLLRIPGGLLDLRHALLEDWSPIRSDAALRRFDRVVEMMGVDPRPWEIGAVLRSTSQRYDARFGGQFRALTRAFSAAFRTSAYRSEWPYHALADGAARRLAFKLARRAGLRRLVTREVLLVDGREFDSQARDLMSALFGKLVGPGATGAVLNNGFEPFHPQSALDMLDARQIVVTRDPRDVYVSGLNAHGVSAADRSLIAFDNDGMNKSFLATDDLALFVARFRRYHEELGPSDPRVLRVRFEDLVIRPEPEIARIAAFLGLDPEQRAVGSHFRPEQSARNVGLWRNYSRQDEIEYLTRELGEWLADG